MKLVVDIVLIEMMAMMIVMMMMMMMMMIIMMRMMMMMMMTTTMKTMTAMSMIPTGARIIMTYTMMLMHQD